VADRINALHRLFDVRCGIGREDDTLPARALTPLKDGFTAGKIPDLEAQLAEYYRERRWSAEGKPTYQCLVELGLRKEAADLYGG
jgi:aldehyde:ferredoxin oxidoreductase